MLDVSLVTLGSPDQLTGGYLYHHRMAERAAGHDAHITFVSVSDGSLARPFVGGAAAMRASASAAVVVVDSIVAAAVSIWPVGRRPLAAMVHQPPGGMEGSSAVRRVRALADSLLYRRCALVMLASEGLVGLVSARRVTVVAPGRDGPAAVGRLPELRRGRAAALLSVGNLVARKGALDLLEAFARLPPEAATLHLVGREDADPAYAGQVKARVARPDLAERVVVHGPLTREEVSAMYGAADAFALASREEPYGTVYGEAMAAGLPVAGWRAGNLPRLAEHDREGVVVEPGDVSALADGLRRLCLDEPYRRRLADAARSRAAAELPTWDDTAARFFGLLRELAERPSPGAA